MRIISGIHRGRVIHPPKNLRARPTTDFAKENLFNVLGNLMDIEGADVLDLFFALDRSVMNAPLVEPLR